MKNRKYIALFASTLCILGTTGCAPKGEEKNLDFIVDFLQKARKSYTLKSNETEIINRSDDTLLVKNEYLYNIENVYDENPRINQTFYTNAGGETYTNTLSLVKDEKGYAALEALDYTNSVVTKAISSGGSKILYDNEFFNPFLLINEDDFIETKTSGVYSLDESKFDLFSYYLFSNKTPLTKIEFTFEGNNFKSINCFSKEFEGTFLDKNTQAYIPVKYHYETTVLLSKIGETIIEGLKPIESKDKEKEAILKNALNELTGNYTVIVNEHDRENPPNHEFDSIWYFDGVGKVYHQQHIGDETRRYDLYYKVDEKTFGDKKLRYYDFNEKTNEWEYNKPTHVQSYNSDPKTYDWFVPKLEGVAPELFTYDAENNKFVCDVEEVIGFIGNNFLPGCYAISHFTNGSGDKCEIILNSDNKVKTIVVGYTYFDTQGFELSTDFEMNYLNINSTTIPSWVEGN